VENPRTPVTSCVGPGHDRRWAVLPLRDMPPTPVAPRHYVLRQEGEAFLPHVLPVIEP
jgi:hypothetical protein